MRVSQQRKRKGNRKLRKMSSKMLGFSLNLRFPK
nr:MAG TPA: hypothetical protein [Caudoviricetes sp.]